MKAELNRVLLSWPTTLVTPPAASKEHPQRTSWMQVAKTGSFVSTRYGAFSITKDDLRTMLDNFTHVTPKPPTRLPVDYDHLSMQPEKPGDGIAAGWMSDLELRNEGTELWARVEWTPDAAKRIEAKEYQFVSPSFVKDHVSKTGEKIGTTLVAAAITNHPFLEGMAAVTLLGACLRELRVPAGAEAAAVMSEEEISMSNATSTLTETIEARAMRLVTGSGGRLRLGDAVKAVSLQDPVAAEQYLSQFNATSARPDPRVERAINLNRSADEGFVELVERVARERRLDLHAAIRLVSEAHPDLAAAYSRG